MTSLVTAAQSYWQIYLVNGEMSILRNKNVRDVRSYCERFPVPC